MTLFFSLDNIFELLSNVAGKCPMYCRNCSQPMRTSTFTVRRIMQKAM